VDGGTVAQLLEGVRVEVLDVGQVALLLAELLTARTKSKAQARTGRRT